MPIPLAQKIKQLQAKYVNETAMPPYEILSICEALLSLIEQNRGDLTEAYEAQIRLDQRICDLEKTKPGYQEPRG